MKKSNEIDIHSNISIICFLIKNNNYLFSFKGIFRSLFIKFFLVTSII